MNVKNNTLFFYSTTILLLGVTHFSNSELKPHEQYEKVVGAVRGGQIPELRDFLSDKNNPIDQQVKDEALYFASKEGKATIVDLLLDNGADPNMVTSGLPSSALDAAEDRSHTVTVEKLLKKGAKREEIWKRREKILSKHQ